MITHVDQKSVNKIILSRTEGSATEKVWLLDVKKHTAILSAKVFDGSSKSSGMVEIGEKGSDRKMLAVANCLRHALALDEGAFLKPFPITRKIERSKVGGIKIGKQRISG